MKTTAPPAQFMRVGFESIQHGQAASQEHASSSWPEIFQSDDFGASAAKIGTARRPTRIDRQTKQERTFIFLIFETPPFHLDARGNPRLRSVRGARAKRTDPIRGARTTGGSARKAQSLQAFPGHSKR